MLTWQKDPLLVDPQPVVWQEWVTANQLLKEDPSRWSPRLFLRDRMLNFYGIMVRKSDFVKKTPRDRVLNRFPYLRLTVDLRKIVKEECYQLGMNISRYLRGTDWFGPVEGRKKVERYLSQGRLPLPFFRVLASFKEDEIDFLLEHFTNASLESFRHERFVYPVQIGPELAYFLGACAGDGTLNPHQIRIIDGHQEYMQRLHSITRNLTATNIDLSRFKGAKAWLLILKSKWFARLIYFLTSQPFGRKYESLAVPKIFQELSNQKELENRYCQGLFDTDGTYDKNAKSVWFGTSSRKLIQDVSTILERRMIHHTVYQTTSHFWNLFVKRSGLVQYAKEIGLISPSKQQGLCRSLEADPYRHEFFGVNRSTIVDQSNYLDFQLLPRLLISDGYYLLKELLDQINFNEQEILKLYSKQRDSWCRSKRVPFNVLYQLGNSLGVEVYSELEKRKTHYAYPYGKYTIRLPAIISDQLLAIMAYFTPFNHGLVVTTGVGRELDRKNVKEVIDLAADLFEISPTSFQRNNDYSFKIANELLRDYAQTFFIYQKPWKALSKREITALLTGWNEIIKI